MFLGDRQFIARLLGLAPAFARRTRKADGPARYFFYLWDGVDLLLDPGGRELPNMHAVQASSLRGARDLISNEALSGGISMAQATEMEDAAGVIVHRLEFADAVTVLAKIVA